MGVGILIDCVGVGEVTEKPQKERSEGKGESEQCESDNEKRRSLSPRIGA